MAPSFDFPFDVRHQAGCVRFPNASFGTQNLQKGPPGKNGHTYRQKLAYMVVFAPFRHNIWPFFSAGSFYALGYIC